MENLQPRQTRRPRLVGQFIREKREALGLSQRALGQKFSPAVTTQFISNVERGATPLPPAHIPILAQALSVSESEIVAVLEQEYAVKLSGRVGTENGCSNLIVAGEDFDFMRILYNAYQKADEKGRSAFISMCRSTLGVDMRTMRLVPSTQESADFPEEGSDSHSATGGSSKS